MAMDAARGKAPRVLDFALTDQHLTCSTVRTAPNVATGLSRGSFFFPGPVQHHSYKTVTQLYKTVIPNEAGRFSLSIPLLRDGRTAQ
jgi:hypothetical protein